MADMTSSGLFTASSQAGKKRPRDDAEDVDDGAASGMRFEKASRPTSGDSDTWPRDSGIGTPTAAQREMLRARYDSDEQSSMISEPGSPQDIPMSSDDEMADDFDMAAFSQSPESTFPSSSTGKPFHSSSSPWHARTSQSRAQRVPTPIIPHHDRPGVRPVQQQLRTALHMRDRHPQENGLTSSDNLEVPSPIDEDEVPTPPSAAEAAGSQLSMLTVNDMEMDPSPGQAALPTISVDTQQAAAVDEASESAIDVEPMDDALDLPLTVRKPRQRSGAVSSPSPIRTEKAQSRGFSMGFRADCEKCRLRVPGHMNHFVAS